MHRRTIQINHQPDATIFQFIILKFVYSPTCFGRFPAHYQELNDCSGSLWFYLRVVVIVALCSWSIYIYVCVCVCVCVCVYVYIYIYTYIYIYICDVKKIKPVAGTHLSLFFILLEVSHQSINQSPNCSCLLNVYRTKQEWNIQKYLLLSDVCKEKFRFCFFLSLLSFCSVSILFFVSLM